MRQGDSAADGFQGQKGDRADGRLRDCSGGKPARALGGETESVVFQGLIIDPFVVLAANRKDALAGGHDVSAPKNAPLPHKNAVLPGAFPASLAQKKRHLPVNLASTPCHHAVFCLVICANPSSQHNSCRLPRNCAKGASNPTYVN